LGLGWSGGGGGSLDNTPPSDDVIPPLGQVHLLGRGPGPLSFRGDRVACGGAFSGKLGCLLCKSHPCFIPLDTAPVVRSVVSSAATALGLFSRGRVPTGEVGAATRDAPGAYPQLRSVCPKHWPHSHCCGPFGATYDTTDTRNPQSSVSDRTFDTSDPRATETMKWGVGGRSLVGS
jgi:hypothetical protein